MKILKNTTGLSKIKKALQLKNTNYSGDNLVNDILNMPFGNIPYYHYEEAGRVIKRILDLKALYPNNIVFGTISDIHGDLTNSNVMASVRHGAFALETVGAMAKCDFKADLGDGQAGINIDDEVNNKDATYTENSLRYALKSDTDFRLVGNHEKSMSTQKIYDLIGKYNNFDNYGFTQIRGYGYKDFTDKKVRVIVLNTCDYWNITGGNGMSYEQKDFLMGALDLSNYSDFTQWTIIILSHIPLDFLGGDYDKGADLKAILKAYNDGTNVSILTKNAYVNAQNEVERYNGKTLVRNYAGINTPRVINIHGHIHTNKYGKLKFIDDNTELDIMRVATPNANFNGNASTNRYSEFGDYSITTEEANKIRKVAGTKADTSVTFYFIDLDNQVIHSIGYGADIDRIIPYKNATVYNVNYKLSNVSSSNTVTGIVEGESYATILTIGSSYAWESVKVTMGGVDITNSAYSNGRISISKVSGNIEIIASAIEDLPYTNLFKSTDADFQDGYVLRSSGATKTGTGFVSGYIEAVSGDTIRVRCPNGTSYNGTGVPMIYLYDSSKTGITGFYDSQTDNVTVDTDGLGFTCKIERSNCAFVRVAGQPAGAYDKFVVTKNEEIV